MDSGTKAALFFWYPLIAVWGAALLVPLALIAVGMSLFVSVEPWVTLLVVLAGWPIAVRQLWMDRPLLKHEAGARLVEYGIGAAWVIGALALAHVLGPEPVLIILIPAASVLMYWALRRLETWTPEGRRRAAAEYRRYGEREAGFIFEKTYGLHVAFQCQEGPKRSYTWDFGDGSGSDLASPAHEYPKPGRYKVTLTVTEAGMTDSVTKTVRLRAYRGH